jgi:hypothetical protein
MIHRSTVFILVACASLAGSSAVADANLFCGGDFTSARKDLSGVALTNGGRVSLYTEEFTWNKCGRLDVLAPTTNKSGVVTWNATALVGSSDGKTPGGVIRHSLQKFQQYYALASVHVDAARSGGFEVPRQA